VGRRHLVIPDCQVRPGVPLDHLTWIGNYAADKKPDRIIVIGDFADMSSLSSYDVGKKSYEGKTYKADIEAGNDAMAMLMRPIDTEIMRCFRRRQKRWDVTKDFTIGNHEDPRILRAIELDRKLEGTISPDDLRYASFGFTVHPFLKPVTLDGVAYCHYFCSGVMGHPITSARGLIQKGHMSAFAGHQQGKDIAYAKRLDGTRITTIIAGSCYQHDEAYLNPQTNNHWRGIFMLHEVEDGSFDEMPVSLSFLKERYG
jgi:hypothetical protein